ncbi:MAG TPA: cytochrome c oxidase assembly protein [Alphaproteobacteria bacterium]|nr:cytochrome c oxidase assembly protein [Alphaproteobacteria bacterium]
MTTRSVSLKTPGLNAVDIIGYAAIAGAGGVIAWLSHTRPTLMPAWGPYEFSWLVYLAATLSLWVYGRGLARTDPKDHPALWRSAVFVIGVIGIYAVLQTRLEYLMTHMFFMNRIQHVVMHHLGPFLIALAWPGETMKRGMPAFLVRPIRSRPVTVVLDVLQQPLIAAVLFFGLVIFWLIPDIHFRAMIDPKLYAVMNWTMILDGLLFWALVLDPRPSPPARVAPVWRGIISIAVMFPQIVLGASIAFIGENIYPYYDFCGRIFPRIDAITDQHIGAIIIWIPPAMMSVIGLLVVLNSMRLNEDADSEATHDTSSNQLSASQWTGR